MTLAWLRLRAWLGWGEPAEALQPLVRVEVISWLVYFMLGIIGFVVALVPRALPDRRVIASFVAVGFALALSSPFGLRAISFRWLTRRRANVPLEIITGSCFVCLPNYPVVFARIGWSQETAKWYNMPIDWDGVVASGAGSFELKVNPATGFVERLRRLGGSSRELTRTWDDNPLDDSTSSSLPEKDAPPAKPTRAQRRAIRRAMRQRGTVWGVKPFNLGLYGWMWLALGVLCITCGTFLLWSINSSDTMRSNKAEPGAAEAITGMVVGLVVLGLAQIIFGLVTLRLWWRQRALRSQTKVTCEGVVESWANSHSFYKRRDETLARVTLDSGDSEVFRVPKIWAYRVRQMGNRIRVTYDPAIGLVEDIQTVIL